MFISLGLNVFSSNENGKAVKGIVFETINNEKVALPLAEIQINDNSNQVTDLEGNFLIFLKDGDYDLKFSFDGYTSVVKEVQTENKSEVYIEVELKKNCNLATK